MPMMRNTGPILAIVACLPSAALAFDVTDCDLAGQHGGRSDSRDLGGGIVAHETGFANEGDVIDHLTLTACESGQQIIVQTQRKVSSQSEEKDLNSSYDDRTRIAAKLDELIASDTVYAFENLGELLEVPENRLKQSQLTTEECACRAFYPELRNGKERFKMEPGKQ
ncbi:hypothetical protein [Tritonibacter mobilis]|uniref:hypothetical protein n=1 Tax=Tritonibacter mobilis TaxID=379347 RepID=UPI0012FFA88D|nr:hypothetical protein [Tritonibacter mobilis]